MCLYHVPTDKWWYIQPKLKRNICSKLLICSKQLLVSLLCQQRILSSKQVFTWAHQVLNYVNVILAVIILFLFHSCCTQWTPTSSGHVSSWCDSMSRGMIKSLSFLTMSLHYSTMPELWTSEYSWVGRKGRDWFKACQFLVGILVQFHDQRDDKVFVFSDNVFALHDYARAVDN